MSDIGLQGLAWPPVPAGLVVEPSFEAGEALVYSFPLVTRARLDVLTPAERGVLEGVRHGLSNAEIARLRGASPRTVANQIASVFKKLGAQSRLDLALLAAGADCPRRECPEARTTPERGTTRRVR